MWRKTINIIKLFYVFPWRDEQQQQEEEEKKERNFHRKEWILGKVLAVRAPREKLAFIILYGLKQANLSTGRVSERKRERERKLSDEYHINEIKKSDWILNVVFSLSLHCRFIHSLWARRR